MKKDLIYPDYYGGQGAPYSPVKVSRAWNLNFPLGSAIKYIARAGKKHKDTYVEDLRKAITFLTEEIEAAESSQKAPHRMSILEGSKKPTHQENIAQKSQAYDVFYAITLEVKEDNEEEKLIDTMQAYFITNNKNMTDAMIRQKFLGKLKDPRGLSEVFYSVKSLRKIAKPYFVGNPAPINVFDEDSLNYPKMEFPPEYTNKEPEKSIYKVTYSVHDGGETPRLVGVWSGFLITDTDQMTPVQVGYEFVKGVGLQFGVNISTEVKEGNTEYRVQLVEKVTEKELNKDENRGLVRVNFSQSKKNLTDFINSEERTRITSIYKVSYNVLSLDLKPHTIAALEGYLLTNEIYLTSAQIHFVFHKGIMEKMFRGQKVKYRVTGYEQVAKEEYQ